VNWRAGAISEWDIASKKKVRDAKVPAVNGDLAADGSRLAWLDPTGAPAVIVADADGKELRRVPLPGSLQAFRLSGNGKRLAVRAWDGSLRIYDADSGALVRTVSDGWSPALHVAYREAGAVVRSVLADGSIREQDGATGRPLRLTRLDLPAGEHFVTASADGRLCATVTTEGAARVWDVAIGRPRGHFAERVWVPHRRIEYGRFGPPPGSPWTEPDCRATALHFAAGGRSLIGATGEGKTITVWDVATGTPTHTIETTDRLTAFGLTPDGATVFTACASTNTLPETVPTAHTVRAWDVASGKPVWEQRIVPVRATGAIPSWVAIRGLQVLSNGDALAVIATEYTSNVIPGRGATEAHRVWVIPRRAGAPTRSCLVHEPKAVAFSADGRWLVSGTTRACDLVSGARYGAVHPHAYSDARYNAGSAAFHPTGKFVALATPEWAGPFDVEAFRKRAEQERKELRERGYDPPDDD
jgi:WD40 repeat protein